MAFVRFIIPTIGRASLQRAIESVRAQTDSDWKVHVVADGAQEFFLESDLISEGKSEGWLDLFVAYRTRSAGLTRNTGKAFNTDEWVAFLDDDDVICPTYVEHLKEHVEDYPWAEAVVFRMKHPVLGVLPPPDGQLRLGTVGISFALRKDIAEQYDFVREHTDSHLHEDWQLISQLIEDQCRIFLSPYTEYLVRDA